MEGLADAVSGVVAHHAVVETLRVGLNDATDDVDFAARADGLDAAHHRVLRALDEQMGFFVDSADLEHRAGVAMHAVLVGGDVDVDDVAVFERAVVRNAVADDLIDGGADGLGEAHVAQARRVGVVRDEEFVADAVEFLGGDTGCDGRADGLDGARCDSSGLADLRDSLGALDLRGGDALGAVVEHVFGTLDVLGDSAHW